MRPSPDRFVVTEIHDGKLGHPSLEFLDALLNLHLQCGMLQASPFLPLIAHLRGLFFEGEALLGRVKQNIGVFSGGEAVVHHAGFDLGGVLDLDGFFDLTHFLEAAELRAFVGEGDIF